MSNTMACVCPRCMGLLETGPAAWRCTACGVDYPLLRGIPDLRLAEDVYLSNADDRAFAVELNHDFDRLDFRGLLERYFELAEEVPPDLMRRQVDHILGAPGRVGRWLDGVGGGAGGPILDLGCGSGSFLAAVAGRGGEFVGVDIALRWLLVARKRLDGEGFGRIPLVCAGAEALPFREDSFGAIVAGDVIEHVGNQAATLAEAHRVLRPGGRLFLASPNRYSLAPEPHVNVWGVGFLPRRWMAPYVRRVKGVEFRAVRTLGIGEWRSLLRSSPFGGGEIGVPPLPASDLRGFGPFKRLVGRVYNVAVARGVGQALLRRVGPLFHVVCRKGGPLPATNRATPRPTRPSEARG